MEYKLIIYMQRNEIYVHSHLALNTALGKCNDMEKENGGTAVKTINSTKTTNH